MENLKNEFPYSDLMHELSIFIFGIYGLPKLGNRYLYREFVEKLQKSKTLDSKVSNLTQKFGISSSE